MRFSSQSSSSSLKRRCPFQIDVGSFFATADIQTHCRTFFRLDPDAKTITFLQIAEIEIGTVREYLPRIVEENKLHSRSRVPPVLGRNEKEVLVAKSKVGITAQ